MRNKGKNENKNGTLNCIFNTHNRHFHNRDRLHNIHAAAD